MTFDEAHEWLYGEEDEDGDTAGGAADKAPREYDLIEGLQILAAHASDEHARKNPICAAEHDIIYCAGDVETMSEAEMLRLDALGFFLDRDGECWAHYV